ncbi:MAG: thiamine biosynthesis lipoprotein [Phenylobacterium sp.]|jgi:thiamine biosynthesis lipoprotein
MKTHNLYKLVNKNKWLALGLAIVVFGTVSCGKTPTAQTQEFQGRTMGTTFMVKVVTEETLDHEAILADINAALEDVNAKMSTYRNDSELTLFNRFDSVEPFKVSAETVAVVREAKRVGQLSAGALDVTIGPLVDLWGFGPKKREGQTPSEQEIKEAKAKTGLAQLTITDATLQKGFGELEIDLSAVAKGYGVDQVAELLLAKNLNNYLVEVGGEMRVSGHKADGSNWQVAIEKPVAGERTVELVIAPQNNGVATSGDYRNYFEQDGIRYSHTLDATTGKPITHRLASVTVIHPSAMTADSLATAINVLGPEKGFALAKANQLAVYLIVKTDDGFTAKYTEQFKPFMVQ